MDTPDYQQLLADKADRLADLKARKPGQKGYKRSLRAFLEADAAAEKSLLEKLDGRLAPAAVTLVPTKPPARPPAKIPATAKPAAKTAKPPAKTAKAPAKTAKAPAKTAKAPAKAAAKAKPDRKSKK